MRDGKAEGQGTVSQPVLKCFPENAAGSGDGRQGRSGELEQRVNQVFRETGAWRFPEARLPGDIARGRQPSRARVSPIQTSLSLLTSRQPHLPMSQGEEGQGLPDRRRAGWSGLGSPALCHRPDRWEWTRARISLEWSQALAALGV